ncbi:glycosyltransferase family 4 protein [Candidatus Woesearchaeota archaeon]|nr:glycosyltransferase family 4 protein [Candidatus Woesearchaeota archaeon]
MQKKINYVVQDYLPKHEAISREVYLLRNSFNSIVVDTLSVKNNADVNFNYKRNPLLIFKINKILKDSIHVYTSFGDRFHLCLINKKIILTGAGPANKEKIIKTSKYYKKINKFVVQSFMDKELLLDAGVDDSKIVLIYPGVLDTFNYNLGDNERFTFLFASSCLEKKQFYSKGIDLLIKIAKEREDIDFIFLWRNMFYDELTKKVMNLKNIKIINHSVNMNEYLGKVNAMILPALTSENVKQIPHSLVESLYAGKPVLTTNVLGISEIIRKDDLGLVSNPNYEELIRNIDLIKQRRFDPLVLKSKALQYFNVNRFLEEHRRLYEGFNNI